MDVRIYTRGSGRFDDHRFVGPEMEFWWRGSVGYWVQTGRPTVLARRIDTSFEVVLCGLPTNRRVEATPIATMLFVVAPAGSDDAATAVGLAADWLNTIQAGMVDQFEAATVIDSLLDESFINPSLGEQSESIARRLVEVGDRLRDNFAVEVDAEPQPVGGSFVAALDSVEGRELAQKFLHLMAMAQHGPSDVENGRMMFALLNMAAAASDAEQAFERQAAQTVLLLPGEQPEEPIRLNPPKEPTVGRSQRPTVRQPTLVLMTLALLMAALILIIVISIAT